MAFEIYDASNSDGLFDILGKLFQIIKQSTTYRSSTLKTAADNFVQTFQNKTDLTDEFLIAVRSATVGAESEILRVGSESRGAAQAVIQLLHEFVEADADQPERSIENSIDYLIDKMETATTHKVDASVVGISLATGGSNVGDLGICYSEKDAKGYDSQHQLAEAIAMKVTPEGVLLETPRSVTSLSGEWPKGSGLQDTLNSQAGGGYIENNEFKDSTYTNVPDNVIIATGTVGTTVKLTDPEKQTVVISGTPTGGFYILQWTDVDSKARASDQISYDASGSTVEGELRNFPGMNEVTVATTGSSPNYTHTITFTGSSGDINQLTSTSHMTGGSPAIAHATTQAGDAGSFLGASLEFDSNGSETTTLYMPIEISPDTCYFLSYRVSRVGAASGGTIKTDIVNGIGGAVLTNTAGTSLTQSTNASAISTGSWDFKFLPFSVKPTELMPIYIKLYIGTAITNTASIYFDRFAVVPGQLLYDGGPFVAIMDGKTTSAIDDNWTLTTTNNRAGELQEYFNRVFNMASLAKYLPTTGTTAIPDSVIG
jgi:hypothetical protein